MQSNCNLNVIKNCLGAITITIVIDSTPGLINRRKKLPNTKTSKFYQKTVGYLSISILLSLASW